jgi:hypothetical protein
LGFRQGHRGGEGKRVKALSLQETGPRADSVHPVEKLCSFYHLDIHRHSRERAGMGNRGGSAVGARYIVRGRRDTTQTVLNIERAQGFCPWSPPQEGARDQSSSARRGLPSKGEARALHHQPAPALTLTIALLFARSSPSGWRNALKHYWKPRLTKTTAKRLRPKNKS